MRPGLRLSRIEGDYDSIYTVTLKMKNILGKNHISSLKWEKLSQKNSLLKCTKLKKLETAKNEAIEKESKMFKTKIGRILGVI